MSGFYNAGGPGAGGGGAGGGGGFYGGSAGGGYDQFQHQQPYGSQGQQQQQQQQPAGYNVSQWQASSQQQQQSNSSNSNTGSMQQQPSAKDPAAAAAAQPFWNPAASFLNSSLAPAMAGMVTQAATGQFSGERMLDHAAQQVWQAPGVSMIPGFDVGMQSLRAYFAVDNRYVKRKMQKVLLPFWGSNNQWKRVLTEGPDIINYALPNSDDNAPDLYLPSMSLITYCLLCALLYGTAGQFNPEVIADVTSKCFVTQILEVLAIRFGFYMMQAPVAILDLFSYTGYKYLGLTVNILVGMLAGHLGYGTSGFYATFLWTASSASYFMLKTMAHNIPNETAATGPKREVMVLAFAASQAASMWFVSQTKFL